LLVATSSSWSPPIPLASWVLWFVLESSITVPAGPDRCRRWSYKRDPAATYKDYRELRSETLGRIHPLNLSVPLHFLPAHWRPHRSSSPCYYQRPPRAPISGLRGALRFVDHLGGAEHKGEDYIEPIWEFLSTNVHRNPRNCARFHHQSMPLSVSSVPWWVYAPLEPVVHP
jgi:hypothetical protein